ncbi:MAG TPA: hypothetical protein VKG63_12390 [Steroidobacteraceae bacterium]|nr:hypothetical protein [Steroidobacteraceae bacterium]
MDHLFYPRHFLLLAGIGALLGLAARLGFSTDVSISFALYGALHASALVLALRAGQRWWRNVLFIAMAAALSVMTLRAGIVGAQVSGPLAGNVALDAVLGFSAVVGAATYGILIRLFGIYELTVKELTVIAGGCLLAAYAARLTAAHSPYLGRSWFAVLWWFAFSGGLWYCDQRRRAVIGRSGAVR